MLEAWPVGCPTIIFFLYCCSQVILLSISSNYHINFIYLLSISSLNYLNQQPYQLIFSSSRLPLRWRTWRHSRQWWRKGREPSRKKSSFPEVSSSVSNLYLREHERSQSYTVKKLYWSLKRWRRVTDLTKHNLYQNMHFHANNPCDISHSAIYRQYISYRPLKTLKSFERKAFYYITS